MAKSVTSKSSINGWANFLTLARAAGYTGSQVVKDGTIVSLGATAAYIHITEVGNANPGTAANGVPIGSTASTAPSTVFRVPEGTDLACLYINTAGAQDITYSFTGK
jgi:hypothetical protein